MKWHYFQLWLFTVMIPAISFMGYVNYINGKWGLVALNVFTVVMSAVNIYQARRNIKLTKQTQANEIWRLLGGKSI